MIVRMDFIVFFPLLDAVRSSERHRFDLLSLRESDLLLINLLLRKFANPELIPQNSTESTDAAC